MNRIAKQVGTVPAGLVAAAVVVFLVCSFSSAQETPGTNLAYYPPQVADLFLRKGAVAIDARGGKDYAEGHLPGAQLLVPDNLRSMRAGVSSELYPAEVLAVIGGRYGLLPDNMVIVYGKTTDFDASYVATALRCAGFTRVAVLDGGFARWAAEGRTVAKERPEVHVTTPKLQSPSGWIIGFDEMKAAVAKKDAIVVDVRGTEAFAKGHIPGALSRPAAKDFVSEGQPEAGSVRPLNLLAEEYKALGVTPEKPIIVYCTSGYSAAATFFLLRFGLGYPDVRLYDGSFSEWSVRPGVTIATGEQPAGVPPAAKP